MLGPYFYCFLCDALLIQVEPERKKTRLDVIESAKDEVPEGEEFLMEYVFVLFKVISGGHSCFPFSGVNLKMSDSV